MKPSSTDARGHASLLLLVALAACAALGPRAQTVPEGPGSANADQHTHPDPQDLAAAHVEAIGGRAAVEAVRGYYAKGTAEIAAQGVRATVEEWVRPGEGWRKRWDVDGFGREEQGFDGRVAWMVRPDRPADATRDEKYREAAASRAVLHPETDLIGQLGSARTIGRREIAGRSTMEVRTRGPAGSVQSRFYDEQTGILRAVERDELLAGRLTRVQTVYDDWRPIEGVLFPHRLTRIPANGPERVRVLESVTTGQVPPEAVRAPAEVVAAAAEDHHEDVVLPALRAAQERFRRAFADDLRLVRLDVDQVVGYEYRDAPHLIEPHIRRFLADLEPEGGGGRHERGRRARGGGAGAGDGAVVGRRLSVATRRQAFSVSRMRPVVASQRR